MNTVKRWLAGILSFAMILTCAPFSNLTILAAEDEYVAQVTTDDSTEPVKYKTLKEAIEKTDTDLNQGKKPVITLLADVTESGYSMPIAHPLTIVIGEFKLPATIELTNKSNSTASSSDRVPDEGSICKYEKVENGVVTEISFAKHKVEKIYNWAYDPLIAKDYKWYVKSITYRCKNCKDYEEDLNITSESAYDKSQYKYNEDTDTLSYLGTGTSVLAFKVIGSTTEGYTLSKKAYIVDVNGVLQHKDGLPVVKAVMYKNDSNKEVDPVITVTAATEEEIEKNKGQIYAYNGTTRATEFEDGDNVEDNSKATCTKYGGIVYKVIVEDPDGNVAQEVFIRDHQAIAKTDHEQGLLKNYQLLKHNETTDSTNSKLVGFATEALARADAKDKTRTVAAITKEKYSGAETETYFYWYWTTVKSFAKSDVNNGNTNDTAAGNLNVADALDDEGNFKYRPVYYCDNTPAHDDTDVYGEAVSVSPYENATTSEEAQDNKPYSKCDQWRYPSISITYEFTKKPTDKLKTKYTYKRAIASQTKPVEFLSHVSDGTTISYDGNFDGVQLKQPTCMDTGKGKIRCSICNSDAASGYKVIDVAKLSHTFGKAPAGTTVTISTLKAVDNNLVDTQKVSKITVGSDGASTVTVEPSCEYDGGVYKYCTGNGTDGHWVKTDSVDKTGHDLVTVVGEGTWSGYNNDFKNYDKTKDYTFTVKQQCNNKPCDGQVVRYHSLKDIENGYTKEGNTLIYDVYGAIDVVDQEKGSDCMSVPAVIYTVKGITNTAGEPVVKEAPKYEDINGGLTALEQAKEAGKLGDHVYVVNSWNWSSDYENATADAKCTVKDNDHANQPLTGDAKVTKVTAANGITTFTATFGESKEEKKVYTLKGAKVTYDTSLITDGNLIRGQNPGWAPQVPAVTVTVNGTIIDSDLYDTSWTYDPASKKAQAIVSWTDEVLDSDDAEIAKDNAGNVIEAKSDEFNYSRQKTIKSLTNEITVNDEDLVASAVSGYANLSDTYKPENTYSVVATPNIKNATVKYAITNKEVKATTSERKADPEFATQKKIEALEFDLDEVADIKDAGEYYVYAQVSKEGYTTYTAKVAQIIISKKSVEVYVDNATIVEGDTPNLHIRVVGYNSVTEAYDEDLDFDPADFVITTAGGESLENLKAGTYRLRVTASNYNISTNKDAYVAVLTVLAKDGTTDIEQAEAEAVAAQINALTDESSAADVAAARAAYDKLNDTQKARINADTLKKLTDAEDKAAANAVIDQLNKATTDADKAAAYEAYSKLSDAQKKLVDAKAADAVAAAKTAKDAADKAAAEEAAKKEAAAKEAATKTAATAKTAAAKVASTNPKYSAVQSAVKALDKVLADKNATSALIKAATDKVNAAVKASKTAGAKKGATYTVGGQKYKATSTKAVTLTKAKNAKSVTVPATVKINGKKIAVTKIGAKAFAKSKATKITIKTKKLTKKGVKKSLKGSKVKTVKVSCGKAYVKKYKKFFTKANAGKKVTVK